MFASAKSESRQSAIHCGEDAGKFQHQVIGCDTFLDVTTNGPLSRRSFIALSGATIALAASSEKRVPVGLELYSVRDDLAKDLTGTVRAVAKMGYEVVEFFSPYYSWTTDYAKEVRKLLDDLGIRCNSTHNSANAFTVDGLPKAIDLNKIL